MTKTALKGCLGLVPVRAPGTLQRLYYHQIELLQSSHKSQPPGHQHICCCPWLLCTQVSQLTSISSHQLNFSLTAVHLAITHILTRDGTVISGLACPLFQKPQFPAALRVGVTHWCRVRSGCGGPPGTGTCRTQLWAWRAQAVAAGHHLWDCKGGKKGSQVRMVQATGGQDFGF